MVSGRSAAFLAVLAGSFAGAPIPRATGATGVPPAFVAGYVALVDVGASAPDLPAGTKGSPEVHALVGGVRSGARLSSRLWLAQDLSRQEVLSTDFVLPAGTLVLHQAGAKFYAIADPTAKTYAVLDAEGVLNALEGGIGITNTAFEAKVEHTDEKRVIAGFTCRKSQARVTYVSAVPLENDTVHVQQTNELEVWHTPELVSSAILDHFFFKYQRDKTGGVQKVFAQEIGFPLEMTLRVVQGAKAAVAAIVQFRVTSVKKDKNLDSELFRIPPAEFARVEKSPFRARTIPAAP